MEAALGDLGYEVREAGNGDGIPPDQSPSSTDQKVAYLRFHAYELDTSCPPVKPLGIVPHLSLKYAMSEADAIAKCEGMARAGESVGLDFNYKDVKISNTFNAHRVLHMAQERGKALRVKERLLRAYFTDGLALGDKATLASLAEECGLDRADVAQVLDDVQGGAQSPPPSSPSRWATRRGPRVHSSPSGPSPSSRPSWRTP